MQPFLRVMLQAEMPQPAQDLQIKLIKAEAVERRARLKPDLTLVWLFGGWLLVERRFGGLKSW